MKMGWAGSMEPRVVRHTLGCLLARVAGKSPLEYLTPWERLQQRNVVLALVEEPPTNIPDLITEFVHAIENYAHN